MLRIHLQLNVTCNCFKTSSHSFIIFEIYEILMFTENKYHKSTSSTVYVIMFECRLNKCRYHSVVHIVDTTNMFCVLHGSEIL